MSGPRKRTLEELRAVASTPVGRATLSRDEIRFADTGHDIQRLETIRALINSATPAEQATLGYAAARDLLQMLDAERDEIDRIDATRPAPETPARFFNR